MGLRKRLDELHAAPPPTLNWREFIEDPKGELTPEQIEALDTYFKKFMHPDGKCPGCGKGFPKSAVESFLGPAMDLCTVEWGLAHGEAYCTESKYPYRGNHYNIGPVKALRNWFLPYHPSGLSMDPEGEHEEE